MEGLFLREAAEFWTDSSLCYLLTAFRISGRLELDIFNNIKTIKIIIQIK